MGRSLLRTLQRTISNIRHVPGAKWRLLCRRHSSSARQETKVNFGICFDIDGVIARGYVPLPEARAAFRLLTDGTGDIKVPTCFVTNALSRNTYKAGQLTEWLGVKVHPGQMVQAQGPLEIYSEYHNKHCLLVGQGPLKAIAADLGLNAVSTVENLTSAYPLLDVADHDKRFEVATSELIESDFPAVEAVVLMGEPQHWATDLQVVIDILLTNGKPSHTAHRETGQTIPVIACNLDLQFMHRAPFPRLGHGAFVLCLESLFKKITGSDLQYAALVGKPSETTFRFAEHRLNCEAGRLGGKQPVETMYMIGDNVDVDIGGANMYQRYVNQRSSDSELGAVPPSRILPSHMTLSPPTVSKVYGILVRTGVPIQSLAGSNHSHRDFFLDQHHLKPHTTLDNVLDAVKYIFHKENFTL